MPSTCKNCNLTFDRPFGTHINLSKCQYCPKKGKTHCEEFDNLAEAYGFFGDLTVLKVPIIDVTLHVHLEGEDLNRIQIIKIKYKHTSKVSRT